MPVLKVSLIKVVISFAITYIKSVTIKLLVMLIVLGVTGAHNVAFMWRNHFQSMYSVGVETKYRALFSDKLSILSNAVEDSLCLFSMFDVDNAMHCGASLRGGRIE